MWRSAGGGPTGDEDDPCLEPCLLMKRHIRSAALVVLPNTGHALNLEEPDLFNRACDDFFHQVEAGRWQRRKAWRGGKTPSFYRDGKK